MAGTGYEYLGSRKQANKIIDGRVEALIQSPLVSAEIDCNAATGLIYGVTVPAGGLVRQVGVFGKTALAGGSGDIDVGDGDTKDLFIDGLTALAVNEIAMGGEAGTNAADPHGGKYYADGDTIDAFINGTAAAGTIKILVWYDLIDPTDAQVLH